MHLELAKQTITWRLQLQQMMIFVFKFVCSNIGRKVVAENNLFGGKLL